MISIHAPRVGSDIYASPAKNSDGNFYPRSPRGERPGLGLLRSDIWTISIHAPRVGSDGAGSNPACTTTAISIHAPRVGSDRRGQRNPAHKRRFLSTLPAWGATVAMFATCSLQVSFLSTLPAWGATGGFPLATAQLLDFYPRSPRGERPAEPPRSAAAQSISIHAPRVGSDRYLTRTRWMHSTNFYPRSPRGERRRIDRETRPGNTISIHAPRVGSDLSTLRPQRHTHSISIHAPRVGSDAPPLSIIFVISHFYPRSPRGERHVRNLRVHPLFQFLSTLPAWGATWTRRPRCAALGHFYPRSPRGERPL